MPWRSHPDRRQTHHPVADSRQIGTGRIARTGEDQGTSPGHIARTKVQDSQPARWKIPGPGLVVAVTGVGAGNMAATCATESDFGYQLLRAVIIAIIMKIILLEGAGRHALATGYTLFEGWKTLGRCTTWYFVPHIAIRGFGCGVSVMSSTALPLAALFPALDLKIRAILISIAGLGMVYANRYEAFEKITVVLVGTMFLTIVILAIVAGLVPMMPDGALFDTLALAGGAGGTITLAANGQGLREKGWGMPGWMRVRQIDNTMAHQLTGIFVIAMMNVGVDVVQAACVSISADDKGRVDMSDGLNKRCFTVGGTAFLVGFRAASVSSIIGVWNGVSLMFADFRGTMRGLLSDDSATRMGGKYFVGYLARLAFLPMIVLFPDRPIMLMLAYGVQETLFMPFLALTLIGLLNGKRIPMGWSNSLCANIALGLTALVFVVLGSNQLCRAVAKLFAG